jgi:aspartyl-tRNA synthetase
MLKASDQQIGYCYSDKDMQFIRSLLITAVDKIPDFCESKNVADAIEDWVKRLNQEN